MDGFVHGCLFSWMDDGWMHGINTEVHRRMDERMDG
jgi:hypothetical protein